MLTPLDKFLMAVFVVVTILCGLAGGLLVVLHLPPDLIGQPHKNGSPLGAVLGLLGMFLGWAVSLTAFGLLSRRFASASTHQRWAEYMNSDSLGFRRNPGLAKLLLVVLIPPERRSSSDIR
jgi:hypothetical protein